jgi:ABC-type oligopeptide transport system substrate-binding subunit
MSRLGRVWRPLALGVLLALGACTRAVAPHDTLRRGNGPEPDSLDPALARSDSAATILRDVYEGLARLDHDAKPIPAAAQAWSVSRDGLTWTYTLRSDERWSNGDPVTADDFVHSWRRLVDPSTGSQYAEVLAPVVNARAIVEGRETPDRLGVEAIDARTLVVHLQAPTAYFAALTAHWSTFPTYHGQVPAPPGETITNGAFVPSEWRVGAQVTALRNPQYRAADTVTIARVRYLHVADPRDEYSRYRGGELDTTYSLPAASLDQLTRRHGAQVHRAPQLGVYFYGFNLQQPPFRDAPQLRRALALAVDRERLVSMVTALGEAPAYGWVPEGVADYSPQRFEWRDWSRDRRVEEAQRLYALAGYGPARPLHLDLRYPTGATHEKIALAVAAMWHEALGVDVRPVGEEFRSLLESINRGEAVLFRSSWIGDYNDPYTFLSVLQSQFGINLVHYRNADYDRWLDQSESTADPQVRRSALESAERTALQDVPLIPLYFYVNKHLVAPRVRGWYDNVMNVVYTQDLSLDPADAGLDAHRR